MGVLVLLFFFFPDKLKNIRKSRGLTQKQLAELSGVSRVAIARYETNQQTPKMPALEKIAKALNVSVKELLENPESPLEQLRRVIDDNSSIYARTCEKINDAFTPVYNADIYVSQHATGLAFALTSALKERKTLESKIKIIYDEYSGNDLDLELENIDEYLNELSWKASGFMLDDTNLRKQIQNIIYKYLKKRYFPTPDTKK